MVLPAPALDSNPHANSQTSEAASAITCDDSNRQDKDSASSPHEGESHDHLSKKDDSEDVICVAQDPASVEKKEITLTVANLEDVTHDVARFHKLSWIRLTSVLIVEAIALGSLSMPATFATLGLVPGLIITAGIGFIAIYSSLHIGNTWLKFPDLENYPLAGGLLLGKIFGGNKRAASVGYWFTTVCFLLLLSFTTGSHALTGKIAWQTLTDSNLCAVGWAGISAIILFILALPKTFSEMAILGYIDFASIITAILITIIAAGIESSQAAGGLDAIDWYSFPRETPTFATAFGAVLNIVFAFAYAQCQFSFMAELRQPKDFKKSIWALGLVEILIYSLTGALGFVLIGADVKSPALLSNSSVVSKVAFGIALPVIFISGSINTQTAARFIFDKMYRGTAHQWISTRKGNIVWVALVYGITVFAWFVAEIIPFFSALLGLISSLFISWFTFCFPPLFWIFLLREGDWKKGKNLVLTIINGLIFLMGLLILAAGTYASAIDIKTSFAEGDVGTPFSCSA